MTNSYVNKQIGNYRLVAEVGSGAFGNVYRGEHLYLKHRVVAIKVMHTAHLDSERERSSFLQEARFLEMFTHPHILPILDVGIFEGFPYLVTEYAVKGSLRDRMQRLYPERVPMAEAMRILQQIGQALQHAHEQNVIHRDLKPANILFNAEGDALLADFGIATTLASASIKLVEEASGSAPYMAPEQFKGILSKEGDQYSLGCITYELLTGHLPFTAPDPFSLGFKHLTETPPPPTLYNAALPSHIEQAILKALSKERTERYPDILAFIAALNPSKDISLTILPHRTVGDETKPLAAVDVNQAAESTDKRARMFTPSPEELEAATVHPAREMLPMEQVAANLSVLPTLVVKTPPTEETVGARATHSVNSDTTLPVTSTDSTILVGQTIQPQHSLSASAGASNLYNVSLQPPGGFTPGIQHSDIVPKQKKRKTRLPLLIAIIIALLLLLIPGTVSAYYTFAYPATVVASITPLQKDVKSSFDIPVVLKNPDLSKNQVLGARLLTATKTQISTGYSSGTGTTAATAGYGTVTLENHSTTHNYYVSVGQKYTGSNGVSIIADQYAIASNNQLVSFRAHSAVTGTTGNLAAYAFNYLYNDGSGDLKMYNTSAFSGGQNAGTYKFVQQGDIDAVANPLVPTLRQNAMASLRGQVLKTEQFIVAPQCTSTMAHDRNAGDKVSSFTVTVTSTCSGEVYSSQPAQVKAADLLKSQVSSSFDPNYQLATTVSTAVSKVKLIDAKHGTLLLTISAEGIWAFHFSDAQRNQLARLINGKSVQDAKQFLAQQTGVSNAIVTISGTFWIWNNVPTNLNNITIKINVANPPKLQGMPGS